MSVYLIYKTDIHHSYNSRDIIGICTSRDNCVDICKRRARVEKAKISKAQFFNLANLNQTQGYSGEGEFQIEEVETDTLL